MVSINGLTMHFHSDSKSAAALCFLLLVNCGVTREKTMMQIITTLLILTCAVALIGCKDSSDPSKQIPKTEPNISDSNDLSSTGIPTIPSADTFEIQGTIVHMNIEGGFFAIDGDDGSKYDPVSLPESFRKNGLKVKVTARLRKDAISFHMYGAIIEVVNIVTQ